jgi:hypothetical protein
MLGTLSAPAEGSQSADPSMRRAVFFCQVRLLAERAKRRLPVTSGSLQRLVQLGQELDGELGREPDEHLVRTGQEQP